jgi:hypothetical protein
MNFNKLFPPAPLSPVFKNSPDRARIQQPDYFEYMSLKMNPSLKAEHLDWEGLGSILGDGYDMT